MVDTYDISWKIATNHIYGMIEEAVVVNMTFRVEIRSLMKSILTS
jgi:hypothetical protein